MSLTNRNLCVFLCFVAGSVVAFQPALPLSVSSSPQRIRAPIDNIEWDCSTTPSFSHLCASSGETEGQGIMETAPLLYKNTDALNDAVDSYCRMGELDEAMQLIHKVEDSISSENSVKPDQSTYAAVMNAYARSDRDDAAEKAEEILSSMTHATPKGQAYSAVILAWSNSKRPDAAQRADSLLSNLWSLYNSTQDKAYLPTRATYTSTITAWARSDQSKKAAKRAEELLEEMEAYYREGYTLLGPTTACVNAVL